MNMKCLFVLGMHRSGTSALARALNIFGCAISNNLIPPSEGDNSLGFWEPKAVVDLNKAIDEKLNLSWNDWRSVSPEWFVGPEKIDFVNRASRVLAGNFGSAPLIVVKDPRICRLAPIWIEAAKISQREPHVVIPIRHPAEVATSLKKRNKLTTPEAYLIWLRHVLDAEYYSRDVPRIITQYDDLLIDPRRQLEKIARKFHLTWPRENEVSINELLSFIDPNQKRQQFTRLEGDVHANFALWVEDVHEIMINWSADGIKQEDYAKLDKARSALSSFTESMLPIIKYVREQTLELEETKKKIDHSQVEAKSLLEEVDTANRELQILSEEKAKFEDVARIRESELYDANLALQNNLDTERARTANLSANLAVEKEKLNLEKKSHKDVASQNFKNRNKVREYKQQIQKLAAQIDDLNSINKNLQHDYETEKSALAQSRAEASDYLKKIDELNSNFQLSVKRFESEVSALNAKLNSRYREISVLTKENLLAEVSITELEQRVHELETVRSSMSEKLKNSEKDKLKYQELYKQEAKQLSVKKSELTLSQRVMETTTDRHRKAEANLRSANDESRRIKDQNRKLKAELDSFESANDKLHSELKQAELEADSAMQSQRKFKLQSIDTILGQNTNSGSARLGNSKILLKFSLKKKADMLRKLQLIDEGWYLSRYPDVSKTSINAAEHFILYGYWEGRQPLPEIK